MTFSGSYRWLPLLIQQQYTQQQQQYNNRTRQQQTTWCARYVAKGNFSNYQQEILWLGEIHNANQMHTTLQKIIAKPQFHTSHCDSLFAMFAHFWNWKPRWLFAIITIFSSCNTHYCTHHCPFFTLHYIMWQVMTSPGGSIRRQEEPSGKKGWRQRKNGSIRRTSAHHHIMIINMLSSWQTISSLGHHRRLFSLVLAPHHSTVLSFSDFLYIPRPHTCLFPGAGLTLHTDKDTENYSLEIFLDPIFAFEYAIVNRKHRVAKCQIFYTDQYCQTRFYLA